MDQEKFSLDKLNKKFDEFPLWKKSIVLLLMLLILGAVVYQIYSVETADETATIKYKNGCVDIYVNRELNFTNCSGWIMVERYNPYDESVHKENIMDEFVRQQDMDFQNTNYSLGMIE